MRNVGPARHDRRARRVLRPRRHASTRPRPVRRASSTGAPRCGTSSRTSSPCSCRTSACRAGSPRASRSGKRPGPAPSGAARWRSPSPARSIAAGDDAARPERRVQQPRDDLAGLLPGVAAGRAHRRPFQGTGAARAGARVRRRPRHRAGNPARAGRCQIDDLQKTFDVFLDERFGRLRRALATPEGFEARRCRPSGCGPWPTPTPAAFPVQVALGRALEGERSPTPRSRPIRTRRGAGADCHRRGQPASAHRRAGREASGDKARASRALETLTTIDHTDVEARRASWSACSIQPPMRRGGAPRWPSWSRSIRSTPRPTPSSAVSRWPTATRRRRCRPSASRSPPGRSRPRRRPCRPWRGAREDRRQATTPSGRRCSRSRWRPPTSARRTCCCGWWSRRNDRGPARRPAGSVGPRPAAGPLVAAVVGLVACVVPAVSSLARDAVAQAGRVQGRSAWPDCSGRSCA